MSDWGAVWMPRYIQAAEKGNHMRRQMCRCGCRLRKTHLGMANGVCLMAGCELTVRRWVRDGSR